MNRTHAPLCFALLTGLCAVGLLLTGCGKEEPATSAPTARPAAPSAAAPAAPTDAPVQTDEEVIAAYPINVCLVCQGRLGDDKTVPRSGRKALVVCGKACADKFKANADKYQPTPAG